MRNKYILYSYSQVIQGECAEFHYLPMKMVSVNSQFKTERAQNSSATTTSPQTEETEELRGNK